jgi:hypothetical protein
LIQDSDDSGGRRGAWAAGSLFKRKVEVRKLADERKSIEVWTS